MVMAPCSFRPCQPKIDGRGSVRFEREEAGPPIRCAAQRQRPTIGQHRATTATTAQNVVLLNSQLAPPRLAQSPGPQQAGPRKGHELSQLTGLFLP